MMGVLAMPGSLTFVQVSVGSETFEPFAAAEAFVHSTPYDSDHALEAEMPLNFQETSRTRLTADKDPYSDLGQGFDSSFVQDLDALAPFSPLAGLYHSSRLAADRLLDPDAHHHGHDVLHPCWRSLECMYPPEALRPHLLREAEAFPLAHHEEHFLDEPGLPIQDLLEVAVLAANRSLLEAKLDVDFALAEVPEVEAAL